MKNITNGDMPAYPILESDDAIIFHGGLTKREAFAMAVMPSIASSCVDIKASHICSVLGIDEDLYSDVGHYQEYVAMLSVIQADALLEELAKSGDKS